jgi:hypothetical protein
MTRQVAAASQKPQWLFSVMSSFRGFLSQYQSPLGQLMTPCKSCDLAEFERTWKELNLLYTETKRIIQLYENFRIKFYQVQYYLYIIISKCYEWLLYLSICLSVCLSIYLFIYLPTYPSIYLFLLLPLGHRASMKRFVSLQFLNLRQSVGLLGLGISPTQGHYLHRTTQTQNKRRQTSVLWVRFDHTIPAFERAKTFHALDRSATVIGD